MREAAWILAYGLAWVLGYYVSTDYWFLPAGLRFASLWYAPRRLWPWLAAVEMLAIVSVVLQGSGYRTWPGFMLGVVVPWLIHAGVVWLGLRQDSDRMPDTPWRMARLLLLMLSATVLTSLVLLVMSVLEEPESATDPMLRLLRFAIGDFIAMLIVVPIWLHLALGRVDAPRRAVLELLLYFLPVLAIVTLIPALRPYAVVYTSLLALVPMAFMAFRHGWQGAGWSLAFTSVAVYGLDATMERGVTREIMQLFLCIVGAVTLMLGAAVSALRRVRDTLTERNVALDARANELRELGARLVRAQEDEQRRIAQELQGELEQGMASIGTRLGLLARTPLEPAQMAAVDSMRGLTQDIHASMREVLVRLRPALLDRHGLEHALRLGPVQDLLADAEVQYGLTVRGVAEKLDADVQGALFRICQEAAVDAVRSRECVRFDIDLSILPNDDGHIAVVLLIECASSLAAPASRASLVAVEGLPGTRDRTLALGGDYSCHADSNRVRHEVHFVLAPGSSG